VLACDGLNAAFKWFATTQTHVYSWLAHMAMKECPATPFLCAYIAFEEKAKYMPQL